MQSSNTQNRIADTVHNVADSSRAFIAKHPARTSAGAFGLGFGVGVIVTLLAGNAGRRRDEGVAHRLGRRMLDVISKAVPDSLSKD